MNYLKSPSPKKNRKEHCHNCSFTFDTAESLEGHLNQSSSCHQSYLRCYKMKNLDAILVSQFSCFFCRVKGSIKLQQHLKRNLECQRKYLEKFKTKSLDELQPLIRNLKRRMMSSRSKVSKNLEYTKRKEAKNKENENRSLFELLNS